jgi:ABC-type lipoprotein release transport system permease subunit
MSSGGPCGVATAGLAAGLLAAFWGTRFARSLVYEVSPTEPAVYAAATALLLVVALTGTLLPARRAARVDPVEVMREG